MQQVMEDLASRFIVNMPPEDLSSFHRIGFLVEEAYWFYVDMYQSLYNLPPYNLQNFARELFLYCPWLRPYFPMSDTIIREFSRYKTAVPVYGAIMLNRECNKCVLVKGYDGKPWGFPKGKVNKDESAKECAIREVLEETGYDITSKIVVGTPSLSHRNKTFFIVPGIEDEAHFNPRVRKEISSIKWCNVDDLPTISAKKTGYCYVVSAVAPHLIRWIASNISQPSATLMSSAPPICPTKPPLFHFLPPELEDVPASEISQHNTPSVTNGNTGSTSTPPSTITTSTTPTTPMKKRTTTSTRQFSFCTRAVMDVLDNVKKQ
ncbi:mRNA-decapping enzyme 2 [Pelomyxa schiedti]|nr:mRNA-decapping enzyme 2 [Pelomyxa schiedti]